MGKKGIALRCDVFLLKENVTVKKHTYFTTAYRSDQDIKDSLSLGDYVVKEFSKDFPDVKELYCKSGNAGCYHGNPMMQFIKFVIWNSTCYISVGAVGIMYFCFLVLSLR